MQQVQAPGFAPLEVERPGSAKQPLQANAAANAEYAPQPLSNFYITLLNFFKHVHIARKKGLLYCEPVSAVISVGLCGWLYPWLLIQNQEEKTGEEPVIGLEALFLPVIQGAVNVVLNLQIMPTLAVEIIGEKETKMKAVQEIYGLTSGHYWTGWFVYYGYRSLFQIVIFLIGFKLVSGALVHATGYLMVLAILGAFMSVVAMGACLSVPFNTVQGGNCGVQIFYMFGMIGVLLPAGLNILLSEYIGRLFYLVVLLPGGLCGVAWFNLFAGEVLHHCYGPNPEDCVTGFSWRTITETSFCMERKFGDACPQYINYSVSNGEAILLLWANVCLYLFVAWWLDNVWPWKPLGVSRPCNFCCSSSFWCPKRTSDKRLLTVEDGGQTVGIAIAVRDLHKEFKDKKAVDGMTLDVYNGELFALLGHNGAGKTTAINCIVGMMMPTSGGAIVNGYDILEDIGPVRQQITICPQDNPFYKEFTVWQHLSLFGSLRGVSMKRMRIRVAKVLTTLGMPEKTYELCETLSGGQKRRLWIATALLAETPVVFLDEPTSGMDPAARRQLWVLFKEMRDLGSSITFTTHYLEEADLLGDRKAVMARGKVQCVGTSLALKRHFGVGYHLRVTMTTEATDASIQQLTTLVTEKIPTSFEEVIPEEERTQSSDAARIQSYTLPYAEAGAFPGLFAAIDAKTKELHISNYSVEMTSLEDIFLKIGEQAEQMAHTTSNTDFQEIHAEAQQTFERGELPLAEQVKALARIRCVQIWNHSEAFALSVLAPGLFAIIYGMGADWQRIMLPPLTFGFACINIINTMMKEKEDHCKHLCLAQGLTVKGYWVGSLFAYAFFSAPAVICGYLAYGFSADYIARGIEFRILLTVVAIIAPIGWVIFTFVACTLVSSKEFLQAFFLLIALLTSAVPAIMISFALDMENARTAAIIVHIILSCVHPLYSFSGFIATGMSSNGFISLSAIPVYGSFIAIGLFTAGLVVADMQSYTTTAGDAAKMENKMKDDDVVNEEVRVQAFKTPEELKSQAVCVQGLMHTYRTNVNEVWKENTAVRGITFGVKQGECFGVLGPNGAGKSTTFNVCTGLVRPHSAGNVFVQGYDMSKGAEMQKAFKTMGCCPQQDPLWAGVSGREHLLFHGKIKGVPLDQLDATADTLLNRLGLRPEDATRAADTYSGGMKRKLCIAMALIGQPPLAFLDEPSAGVDAAAKRHLWKVIKLRVRSQSIVVTTHSMEEAEALCDRIAIQVKGQLRAIGAPHHIKNKYASGYRLEIMSRASDQADELTAFVKEKIAKQAEIAEHHLGRYLFVLPALGTPDSPTFGQVFTVIQENMQRLNIIDYALSQPTLEQVFLRFAREQEMEDDADAEVGNEMSIRASLAKAS